MDSLLCWNVRGLSDCTRQYDVRAALQKYQVSIAGLLETKIKDKNRNRIMNSFPGWKFFSNNDFLDSGRILVLWRESALSITCLAKSAQFVHCCVKMPDLDTDFLVTFIYGFNSAEERTSLWNDIRTISTGVSFPWLLIGDMNTTLSADERMRNDVIVPCDTSELQNLTLDLHIQDLRYTGHRLTWNNKQSGDSRLFCKLDRALVNDMWFLAFENSTANFHAPGPSDHSPCVVNWNLNISREKSIFRFCTMWTRDPQFLPLVIEAWNIPVQGTPMYKVTQKLKEVKRRLKSLHRLEYAKISEKVKDKAFQLARIQDDLASDGGNSSLQEVEKCASEEYQSLLRAELELLQQRTKLDWLTLSDQNNAYFHSKIKEKRAAKRITSVFNFKGDLVTNERDVENEFLNHFSSFMGATATSRQHID